MVKAPDPEISNKLIFLIAYTFVTKPNLWNCPVYAFCCWRGDCWVRSIPCGIGYTCTGCTTALLNNNMQHFSKQQKRIKLIRVAKIWRISNSNHVNFVLKTEEVSLLIFDTGVVLLVGVVPLISMTQNVDSKTANVTYVKIQLILNFTIICTIYISENAIQYRRTHNWTNL